MDPLNPVSVGFNNLDALLHGMRRVPRIISADGRVYEVVARDAGLVPVASLSVEPLTVRNASTESDAKISVLAGTVNSWEPKIWDGSALRALTYTSGDPPAPPTITITQSGFILLAVEVNRNGTITQVRVVFSPSIPADIGPDDNYAVATENTAQDPDADAGVGYLPLAQITYTAPVLPATVGTIGISLLNVGSKGYELASDDSHRFWRL